MAGKIAAWSSWSEWRAVYGQLASQDADERARGVRRVQTWRTRGKMPVAIDVTATFVEVMLHDPEFNADTSWPRTDHELQLMYSMGIVRLVNGIVDTARRGAPTSMSALAEGLEWPQFFVDLRHEVSHYALPMLPVLRLAAKEALWMLLERFWRPQLSQLERRERRYQEQQDLTAATAVSARKAPAVRDRRVVDGRLRAAFGARAAKKLHESEMAQSSSVAPREDAKLRARLAVQNLAGLAVDETRLLRALLDKLQTEGPSADQRQVNPADVILEICEYSSDNFPLRLARELLLMALGLTGRFLDAVADNAPGVRNICDEFADEVDRGEVTSMWQVRNVDMEEGATDCGDSCKLGLDWLQCILKSLPLAPPVHQLSQAMQTLTPLMRRCVFRKLTKLRSPESVALAQRAVAVWEALHEAGMDSDAASFVQLCRSQVVPTSGVQDIQPAGTQCMAEATHGSNGEAQAGAGPSTSLRVSVAAMEALLSNRKRRYKSPQRQTSRRATKLRRPWTELGTTIDETTLQVKCHVEGLQNTGTTTQMEELWCRWAQQPASLVA